MSLPVCILTSQYFAWGKYGGFGSMSRQLATALAGGGVEVEVIVPRRRGQRPVELVDGVSVRSFDPLHLGELWRLLRTSRAAIFHSQDPSLLTWIAQRAQPSRVHLVTCRDPRDPHDWWVEFRWASARRRFWTPFNYLTEAGPLVQQAVRSADRVFCPAHFLCEKATRIYRPRSAPTYLPNLIDVPEYAPEKLDPPTFAFVARWDRRKRPDLFLALAPRFPAYSFIAVGRGEDESYDAALRNRYGREPNLEMPGFVHRFEFGDTLLKILRRSWALVNTAVREGLPLTFLEAAAQGCAIVSDVDPDEFATKFGVRAERDDFSGAIKSLLAGDPRQRGREAYEYVRRNCERSVALAAHLRVYEQAASGSSSLP